MSNIVRTLVAEPAPGNAPRRVWRDWAIVAIFSLTTVTEGLLRTDLLWPVFAVVITVVLASTLLWRRRYPLAMAAIPLLTFTAIDLTAAALGEGPVEVYSGAFVLIAVYALFRWDSGTRATIGLVIALFVLISSLLTSDPTVGDIIGGTIVLLFPALLGALVRYEDKTRRQQLDRIRFQERELLARELHDTVAHHVSAIAVQAQAGRFLADSSSLEGAAEALATIEEEASRTLAEMRSVVDVLRSPAAPEATLGRGVADIESLAATANPGGPPIEVAIVGDVDTLAPSVDAALYRIAQEAITNTVRHGVGVTRVEVRIVVDDDAARIVVDDDGRATSPAGDQPHFGLVGMRERAALLGGQVDAGPRQPRGWRVEAALPRRRPGA